MKPPVFEFYDPRSSTDALTLLNEHGTDAKILAGGQSLMPLLNLRLTRPKIIVDVNRIPELTFINAANGGGLAIGGLTRQRVVERSALVREQNPLLAASIPLIGHLQIRNRGTIGGSLVHADPAAELPAVALLLEAELVLCSSSGQRVIHAKDFFSSYFNTAIEPTELLSEIRFPLWNRRCGWAIEEISRRQGDFAVVGVVTLITLDADGICDDARVALFGVGATAVRIATAEAALKGTRLHGQNLAEAATIVSEAVDPDSDVHATAEYRREVAGVLTRRALELALQRLREANRG